MAAEPVHRMTSSRKLSSRWEGRRRAHLPRRRGGAAVGAGPDQPRRRRVPGTWSRRPGGACSASAPYRLRGGRATLPRPWPRLWPRRRAAPAEAEVDDSARALCRITALAPLALLLWRRSLEWVASGAACARRRPTRSGERLAVVDARDRPPGAAQAFGRGEATGIASLLDAAREARPSRRRDARGCPAGRVSSRNEEAGDDRDPFPIRFPIRRQADA